MRCMGQKILLDQVCSAIKEEVRPCHVDGAETRPWLHGGLLHIRGSGLKRRSLERFVARLA